MSVNNALIEKALELKPQDKIILIEALVTSLDKPDPEISKNGYRKLKPDLKLTEPVKQKGYLQKRYLDKLYESNIRRIGQNRIG